jgi:hypothetical protein
MSEIRFLLDEHVTPVLRAQLIQREPKMVVWVIGDPGAPDHGTLDPDILLWCETNHFSLVTNNRRSMPVHLQAHLEAGHHVPGIFTLNPDMGMGAIIEELCLIWGASDPAEYRNTIIYLPIT